MKKLIKRYIKKDDKKLLHKLRIKARKKLSKLALEGKTDLGLVNLLKESSKLRDSDVAFKICKNKKIKKYLKKRHKKLRNEFIGFLNGVKRKTVKNKLEKSDINKCKNILSESFLGKDDKTLHKIRLEIKKCRYTNSKYEKELKKIQDNLGKAHDYYKCEKLMKKFDLNNQKIIKKKQKFIKKAQKAKKEFLKVLPFYSVL